MGISIYEPRSSTPHALNCKLVLSGASLEERFTRLMTLLKIEGTAAAVKTCVAVPQVPLSREGEVKAAGGIITADERKAEGLAD